MFILNPLKAIRNACRTGQIIEKALLIVSVILSLSCSHPICEEVKIKEEKKVILKSITLQPGTEGIDAIVSSYYPTTNFGDSRTLSAACLGGLRYRYVEKGYIDFDLSNLLPSDANIKKAILKLFADTVNQINEGYSPIGHYQIDVIPWRVSLVTSPWTEKNITWFNQLKISTEELMVLNGGKRYDQAFLLDVTGYIEKKIKKEPGVYGLVFEIINPLMYNSSIRFCSSDHQNRELRPELNVEYEMEQ